MPTLLAHGVGGRSDLPLPLGFFIWGAVVALVVSFAAVGVFWTRPRLADAAVGRPVALPTPVVVGVEWAVRLVALAVFGVALLAAFAGDLSPGANPAPRVVYVLIWVGGQFLSALFGGAWQALNPFDTIGRLAGVPEVRGDGPPRHHWVAAAALAGFHWVELAYHESELPRSLAWFMAVYTVIALAGMLRYGRAWLAYGEGFAAWFRLLGSMAPIHRDATGAVRLRAPFAGLARAEVVPGTLALVLVVLGGTTFDGVSRTDFWRDVIGDRTQWAATGINTVGLIWTTAIVTALYLLAVRVAARITGDEHDPADDFLPSLVPIALGYAVAHYFSFFVFEGQNALIQLSDPFARGWNLLGTATWRTNLRLLSTDLISWVQALGVVVGHVVAVVAAHDKAIELYHHERATRSQYAMLVVMIAYTIGGLTLLINA